jgi:hypothetical protein
MISPYILSAINRRDFGFLILDLILDFMAGRARDGSEGASKPNLKSKI